MVRVACIGECMIELSEHADGSLTRSYGGDTLNTALYMARLGTAVDYVTALGDDGWSDEMLAAWKAEGIRTGKVLRLPGRLPGLYVIQTDPSGERRFQYWRDSAAARDLFALDQTPALVEALARDYSLLYLSGITLSLYGDKGRAVLFEALDKARAAGVRIAFDTNFRTRGWPDRELARQAYRDILDRSDIALASTEDLDLLFGEGGMQAFLDGKRPAELVLKLAKPSCRVLVDGTDELVEARPVERVVDTTAAGDSFAAAYLTARLSGANPVDAARAGHRLAGVVVGYRGAIIPRAAMPSDALKREGAGMTPRDVSIAADLLLEARRTGGWLTSLPSPANPETWDDAYAIQDLTVRKLGPRAGWKVGATTPDAEPFRAALTADTVFDGATRIPAQRFNVIGVEAELVYRFTRTLIARQQPYEVDEVLDAVGSVHAAIEIVDTRFAVWNSVDRLAQVADQMNHGVLVVGSGRSDWREADPVNEPVVLSIEGKPAFEAVGGNSAGDPLRMLVWLANSGARSLGGIKAGDQITTGSCTGTIFVEGPCRIAAEFPGVGKAVLEIV